MKTEQRLIEKLEEMIKYNKGEPLYSTEEWNIWYQTKLCLECEIILLIDKIEQEPQKDLNNLKIGFDVLNPPYKDELKKLQEPPKEVKSAEEYLRLKFISKGGRIENGKVVGETTSGRKLIEEKIKQLAPLLREYHAQFTTKPEIPIKEVISAEKIKEIVSMAWKDAANTFRMYPNIKHTFAGYWDGAKGLYSQFQTEQRQVTDEPYEPYFGWCDVDKCDNEGCCGGTGWSETGYWTLCTKHSRMAREGKKQPKMKQSAIERESKRDKKTGFLKR